MSPSPSAPGVGFASQIPVAASQIGPDEWELTHVLTYHGSTQTFTVPIGARTDFASVPRVLTWLVPTSTGIAAAILHDHLWRVEAPAGRIAYREADGILRQALGTLRVPDTRRWLMWAAVRWSALRRPAGRVEWSQDARMVLLVTLAALPLLIPVIVVAVFLGGYSLIETTVTRVRRD